jgi:hypothetical protein
MAKVFISFNYDDIDSKKSVTNWKGQNIGTDISFSAWDGESESAKGKDYVKAKIRSMIDESDTVLALVGNDSHNRPWVNYEVAYAKSQGKKVIWTQLPNTTGAPPKEIQNSEPVEFRLKSIQEAIRKNH